MTSAELKRRYFVFCKWGWTDYSYVGKNSPLVSLTPLSCRCRLQLRQYKHTKCMPFLTFQSFLISLGAVFSETHVLEQGDLKRGFKGGPGLPILWTIKTSAFQKICLNKVFTCSPWQCPETSASSAVHHSILCSSRSYKWTSQGALERCWFSSISPSWVRDSNKGVAWGNLRE